jgi:hypothetical protein
LKSRRVYRSSRSCYRNFSGRTLPEVAGIGVFG